MVIDLRSTTFCYPNCANPDEYIKQFVMSNHGITPLEFDILITVIPMIIGPLAFWFIGKRLGWVGDKVPKELRKQ